MKTRLLNAEKSNRTMSIPSDYIRRIEERSSNRSAQVTEELGNYYALIEAVKIKSKFTQREFDAMIDRMAEANFDTLTKSIPAHTLVIQLFGSAHEEVDVPGSIAPKVTALSLVEQYALVDELRHRYFTDNRQRLDNMIAAVATTPPAKVKKR